MQPFRKHTGLVAPLDRVNVDTDQIIPKQFLKRIERTGFGQFLFNDWRFSGQGDKIIDFILHEPRYQGATILVAGKNFGCGSSRARRLGPRRFRVPRRHCLLIRRHLRKQQPEERPPDRAPHRRKGR